MSHPVIDASIVLSWLLADEESAASLAIRNDLLSSENAWVPAHWRLELANALWMAERRRRLDLAGITRAMTIICQLPVTIDPETNTRAGSETLSLARHHQISVYDAAYLELALRRGAALASLDRELRAAAQSLSIPVLPR